MKNGFKAIFAACALAVASSSSAMAFPDGPVTLIVPFGPGGTSDQAARPLAAALERHWGQSVIVSNKPGAGSAIGMNAAATAQPDGHTLTIANPAYTLLPSTYKVLEENPTFDPAGLVPVARIANDPIVMVVKSDAPWQTFEEFMEDAKNRPGEISYASSGIYGAAHVPVSMLGHEADVEFNHVAYQGGGPSMTALLGGHVDMTVAGPAVAAPMIESGQIRPLAHTGKERLAIMPDVPAILDFEYSLEYYLWSGVFTSSAVPEDVLEQLRNDVKAAMEDPQYLEDMKTIGVPVQYLDGAAFAEVLAENAVAIEEAVTRIGKIQ
jgi:tripartite-type tricarboxylate transporter receptor subunit TctC